MITALLWSLFLSAFGAATLLPGSSELVLTGVLASGKVSTGLAIGVATLGNTFGSSVNWILGRFFAKFKDEKWFPLKADQYDKLNGWYYKWGLWTLFASWVPIIGDPLTVIAGIARTPFAIFFTIVLIAKLLRYLAVAGVFQLFW